MYVEQVASLQEDLGEAQAAAEEALQLCASGQVRAGTAGAE